MMKKDKEEQITNMILEEIVNTLDGENNIVISNLKVCNKYINNQLEYLEKKLDTLILVFRDFMSVSKENLLYRVFNKLDEIFKKDEDTSNTIGEILNSNVAESLVNEFSTTIKSYMKFYRVKKMLNYLKEEEMDKYICVVKNKSIDLIPKNLELIEYIEKITNNKNNNDGYI